MYENEKNTGIKNIGDKFSYYFSSKIKIKNNSIYHKGFSKYIPVVFIKADLKSFGQLMDLNAVCPYFTFLSK